MRRRPLPTAAPALQGPLGQADTEADRPDPSGGSVTGRKGRGASWPAIGLLLSLALGPIQAWGDDLGEMPADMVLVPDDMVPEGLVPETTAPAPAPVARPPENAIEEAWAAPAADLTERVWRTRRAALERGVWSLDGAARALQGAHGGALENAEAALAVAPDLPSMHMELARALWLKGDSPLSAVRTATGALMAFGQHPEGALWLAGSLLQILALGLMVGGLLAIAVMGVLAMPHAAHDLGDLFSRSMPAFGRTALLLALLLVVPVFGEGLMALALGLATVAAVYGSNAQRVALVAAALAIVAGAHPVARLAGVTLEALPNDPIARAALATSRGIVLADDVARLESAPKTDLMARQGLARLARRRGNFGRADALYQELVRATPGDTVVLTNAANVRLHLGHMEAAFDLYEEALLVEESPVVLFNLSQAYGRAFQVDDLTRALERAQALDGDLVADLTRLQGTQPEGLVVDLPFRNATVWRRVLEPSGGQAFAAELRAPVAPGPLGAGPAAMAAVFAAAIGLGWMIGMRLRPSGWCSRCGRRVCPRCHPDRARPALCAACNTLFYQPEQTDRELRLARMEALRDREARMAKAAWAASIALPGAAGVLARRPLRSVVGAISFAVALGAFLHREGAVPDPLIAGAAGPFAFLCVTGFFALVYAYVVATSLAARRSL